MNLVRHEADGARLRPDRPARLQKHLQQLRIVAQDLRPRRGGVASEHKLVIRVISFNHIIYANR